MPNTQRRRLLLAASSGLLLPPGSMALAASGASSKQPPLKIGFLYDASVEHHAASHAHAESAGLLKKQLGRRIELVPAEQVPEGKDALAVLRRMCVNGCKLIFGTAYGFMDPIIRVAREYPDVRFETHAGFKAADNVGNYNARFYEARYLAGVVAASATRSGILAYIAPVPVPEVLMGINAYTLGARSVNPDITVRVIWTNNWRDPARERDAAYTLVSQKADVFTHHTDTVAVAEVARDRKLKFIGFQADYARLLGPGLLLASVLPRWDAYYLDRTRQVLAGTWQPDNTWGGLKDGMVRLSMSKATVPLRVRREVQTARQRIVQGKLHIFDGTLHDNDGSVRQLGGQMEDATLKKMDWLVQGVIGRVS
ncbi:MAG: BMP family ABC transporter substrate-binding protein [Lautropia sp.]|nr:BMP family ABC transporter substrate-binding protein [Lautropia sp.]